MDDSLEFKVKRAIWLSIIIVLFFITLYNINDPWIPVFLSGLLIFSVTIRNIIVYPTRQISKAGKMLLYFDVMLVLLISCFDSSEGSQVYYFALIADALIDYSYLFGGSVTVFCFLANLIKKLMQFKGFSSADFFHAVTLNSLILFAFFAVMCFAKYEINQRRTVSKMMYELKIKTKKLEDMYIKLRDNTRDIEEMTILKERNKIAREIHDTMGHTLTSVLIELEAGERLLKSDQELAAEKIRLAKGQVRKGLRDIRESVGILNAGKEIIGFVPSLKLLLDEIAKHGDIFVRYELSDIPQLTEMQEKALFRALQEGLTNGIKHGKSTAFVFTLKYENGNINFHLQDNGTGCDKIVFGFGLSAMEQRIRGVGGVLNISSSYGEGCSININIPIVKQEDVG